MKKINSESTVSFIFIIIILAIIIITIYLVINSSKTLKNNSVSNSSNNLSDENNNDNNDNSTTNNSKNITTTDEEEKQTTIVETQIATFTTTIYDKDENRIFNIELATSILNETIIKAGETFSFNQTIGSMGESDGYKLATGFDSEGNKIEVAAGGMCQISSTIYNTALIANFEIIERHAHSSRVYYVPVDKDATVYYDSVDLKFKNNLEYDIKVIATTDGNNVTVTFNKLEEKEI